MHTVRLAAILVTSIVTVGAALPFGTASVTTSADVTNLLPTIADIALPATVNPTAGSTTAVPVTITVGDGNGFQDVSSVQVTVLKPDGSTVHIASASATPNNDGSGTSATFSHSFLMNYYDDPATGTSSYKVKATATDAAGAVSAPLTKTFHYSELVALELSDSAIEFGSVAPGARSDADTLGIQNMGNVRIDLQTSGTDLSDGDGHSIAKDRIRYDLGAGDFGSEQSLTGTPYTNAGFDLAKGPSSSKLSYWALETPSGDDQYVPSGTYTGTVTLSAIKG